MKNLKSFESFNESEKWIQDAIKRPGLLENHSKRKRVKKLQHLKLMMRYQN
jgi:hypothetical protein